MNRAPLTARRSPNRLALAPISKLCVSSGSSSSVARLPEPRPLPLFWSPAEMVGGVEEVA
ncbi:hypothetical protein D3C80_1227260 [compost metagenome]